jgi:uncharacterized SAM-binding protein YcdF (DUF218 family)
VRVSERAHRLFWRQRVLGACETDYLYSLLDNFGIPQQCVLREDRSRNTYENAIYTKQLVKPKPGERWLLVTSVWRMPRAVGSFRRVGFPVEAYPVDWHTLPCMQPALSCKFGGGLAGLDTAVHEWLGLFAYWATGRTSALFPVPVPGRQIRPAPESRIARIPSLLQTCDSVIL